MKVEKADLKKLNELHEAGKLVGVFETSNEAYHAAPGISKSNIDDVGVSPATYLWRKQNPKKATDAMEFGTLLHTLVLEPVHFSERYHVVDVETKSSRVWKDAVLANPDKISVKSGGEYGHAKARLIAEAARKHSKVKLLDGLKELSFFWKDAKTGLLCKCRPDNLTDKGVVVDYKSAEKVWPKAAWERVVYAYSYHVSAAFTIDGIRHALDQAGVSPEAFPVPKHYVFYAQEKTEPFLVKQTVLRDASIILGRRTYEEGLATIKKCESAGVFPGYPEEIEEIDCPEYAWKDEVEGE